MLEDLADSVISFGEAAIVMRLDAAKWAANMLTMLLPRTRKRKDVQCVIKDAGLKSKRSGKKKN